MSMLQEVQRIAGTGGPVGAELLAETDAGVCDLHYHSHYPVPSVQDAVERRDWVKSRLQGLRDCGLFVATLGVTETWRDNQTGLYLNASLPFSHAVNQPGRHTYVDLSWPDLFASGVRLIEEVRAMAPLINIVLTVSPVPLNITFSGHDIAVASTRNKARLVAVAHELAATQNVDYFSSYEMVTLSDPEVVWEADRRHVQGAFVAGIVSHFVRTYMPEPMALSA